MSYTKIETEVIKQSAALAKELPSYLKLGTLNGKFVAYYNGTTLIADTHEECYNKAEKEFGPNKGYALSEVTAKKVMLSALIKF